MELKEQISNLRSEIKEQEALIASLRQQPKESKLSNPEFDNSLLVLEKKLADDQELILNLKRQYDQKMLSGMVKNGIKNDETMGWWMNRY